MIPGVNDGSRSTGTLPKSNRRNDRNREVIGTNEQSIRSVHYHGRSQHSNNLLDWQPVNAREFTRTTKNSNARTTLSAPPLSFQDFTDIVTHGKSQHQQNYPGEDNYQWQEMAQPVDSRAQSPPHVQGIKPINVNRMPDRCQVESRLNQIRDYIRVTSNMMESLSQSNDPRARTQHEKLSRMVEDLRDSEIKLAKLLENYQGPITENGEGGGSEESVESQLRKKMEASQRKLAELQDQQTNLVGMQLRVQERLNEARQAQQALLLQENQMSNASSPLPGWDTENRPQQLVNDAEMLESETAALKGKLLALQTKKKEIGSLVTELQAIEMSDRASCSSDNLKYAERDKVVELETLKQQLAHLKSLMEEATRVRDSCNPTLEHAEIESHGNASCFDNCEGLEEKNGVAVSCNSFDRNSETDEIYSKFNNSTERLTVDQIQAVTRELKEQQVLLQSARVELQRLKNPPAQSLPITSAPVLLLQNSTPPSSLLGSSSDERKSSNIINANDDITHGRKRPLDELVRKDLFQSFNVNRDGGSVDLGSRRGSNSQLSHCSTSANAWPASNVTVGESIEQSVDGMSTAENLLDIGPQITIESSTGNNWWTVPTALPMVQPLNVGHAGSVEYYRQLLMGSQAQQLQTMSTTMQQCCQLLWSQQRELQSIRAAIAQLQQNFRQTLNQPRIVNNNNHEDYSNLSRSTHHFGNTLDISLPPSSSLPNLVSLPTASSSTSSHPINATSTNSQHHNNQQLNNQVPPGNRANNYWDNFRSYSRQNLLSGNSKTITDSQPGPSSNSSMSTNTTATSVHTSLVRDKRNREHGTTDNISLPSVTSSDAQYSLNLQFLSSNLQIQDRENPAARNNILTNEATQSQQVENFWEEAHSSFRLVPESNDDIYSLRHLSGEMRDVLLSLVAVNRKRPDYLVLILKEIRAISEDQRLRPRLLRSLRALHDIQPPDNPLNETIYQTASESCQSSDDDSDVGAQACSLLNSNIENQSLIAECVVTNHHTMPGPQSMPALLVDHFDFESAAQMEHHPITLGLSATPGYNEDLAEADQSRPETLNNQQNSSDNSNDGIGENNEIHGFVNHNAASLEADREILDVDNGNDDVAMMDNSILDRIPTRLLHH